MALRATTYFMKAPFCDKLSGMKCTKVFGRDMVYTLRVIFQDNQGLVQFRNGRNEAAELRKNKAVGIRRKIYWILQSWLPKDGKYG